MKDKRKNNEGQSFIGQLLGEPGTWMVVTMIAIVVLAAFSQQSIQENDQLSVSCHAGVQFYGDNTLHIQYEHLNGSRRVAFFSISETNVSFNSEVLWGDSMEQFPQETEVTALGYQATNHGTHVEVTNSQGGLIDTINLCISDK